MAWGTQIWFRALPSHGAATKVHRQSGKEKRRPQGPALGICHEGSGAAEGLCDFGCEIFFFLLDPFATRVWNPYVPLLDQGIYHLLVPFAGQTNTPLPCLDLEVLMEEMGLLPLGESGLRLRRFLVLLWQVVMMRAMSLLLRLLLHPSFRVASMRNPEGKRRIPRRARLGLTFPHRLCMGTSLKHDSTSPLICGARVY